WRYRDLLDVLPAQSKPVRVEERPARVALWVWGGRLGRGLRDERATTCYLRCPPPMVSRTLPGHSPGPFSTGQASGAVRLLVCRLVGGRRDPVLPPVAAPGIDRDFSWRLDQSTHPR